MSVTAVCCMRLVSRILGWMLSGVGVFLSLGFLLFEANRRSSRPFWIDALTIVVVGALPLLSGILLLRRRYELLNRVMRLTCVSCIVLFALCSVSHLLFPEIAPSQLGVIAAAGLVGAAISGMVWVTAWIRCRTKRRAIVKSREPSQSDEPRALHVSALNLRGISANHRRLRLIQRTSRQEAATRETAEGSGISCENI
jgi:hypothetical protein